MPSGIASAPGKVILFGEHAVVYGVTAIAASLSDLRIVVESTTTDVPELTMILPDLFGSDPSAPFVSVPLDLLQELPSRDGSEVADANHPRVPTTEELNALDDIASKVFNTFDVTTRARFQKDPGAKKAVMAVIFLVSSILPELVSEKTGSGVRISARTVSLPVGAGLGSSAAFSVALAGSLWRLRNKLYRSTPSPSLSSSSSSLSPHSPTETASSPSSSSSSPSASEGTIAREEGFSGIAPESSTLEVINGWSFSSEVILHGKPSGLDNTVSSRGGALKYVRSVPTSSFLDLQHKATSSPAAPSPSIVEPLPSLPPLSILLSNTCVPRETSKLVGGVRVLDSELSSITAPIFLAIEAVSSEFLSLVSSFNNPSAGATGEGGDDVMARDVFEQGVSRLIRINQSLLCALGVGHSSLDAVVAASAQEGFAAKLTGAGGGGCAITLLSTSSPATSVSRLSRRLEDQGIKVLSSKMGGPGLLWHEEARGLHAPLLASTTAAIVESPSKPDAAVVAPVSVPPSSSSSTPSAPSSSSSSSPSMPSPVSARIKSPWKPSMSWLEATLAVGGGALLASVGAFLILSKQQQQTRRY